jgi:hypothetical protein
MSRKTSTHVKRRSGSMTVVVRLSDRRSLVPRMHRKQFGSADVLSFPLQRPDEIRPRVRRDALSLFPLLNGGQPPVDVSGHFFGGRPGGKDVVKLAHGGEYASDELSAQGPTMIPMTAPTPERTIRPMGRNVTPVRFRAEMAKRLESARRVAGFATKKQAADRLGIGLDRYEKWESGRTPVPAQYIGPVCELYGVDANYLFGTDPMQAIRSQRESR